jgi:hypothetical protein
MRLVNPIRTGILVSLLALPACSRTSTSPTPSPSVSASASEHAHELHLPPAGPTVSVALDGTSVDVALASLSPDGGPTTLGLVWKAAWPSEDPALLRIAVGTHDVSFDDALGLAGCYRVKATVRIEASRAGKAFGEACVTDQECAGAVCFHKRLKGPDAGRETRDAGAEPVEHDGYCSMSCNTDADCPVPPTRGRCGARGMCKRPE